MIFFAPSSTADGQNYTRCNSQQLGEDVVDTPECASDGGCVDCPCPNLYGRRFIGADAGCLEATDTLLACVDAICDSAPAVSCYELFLPDGGLEKFQILDIPTNPIPITDGGFCGIAHQCD